MWSNLLTFVKHYALDLAARSDATFGRAVLQSLMDRCSWNSSFHLTRGDTACQALSEGSTMAHTWRRKNGSLLSINVILWDTLVCLDPTTCPPSPLSESSTNASFKLRGYWGHGCSALYVSKEGHEAAQGVSTTPKDPVIQKTPIWCMWGACQRINMSKNHSYSRVTNCSL